MSALKIIAIWLVAAFICSCTFGFVAEKMGKDRKRRWPRGGYEQHRSYFSDCRRMYPDEF